MPCHFFSSPSPGWQFARTFIPAVPRKHICVFRRTVWLPALLCLAPDCHRQWGRGGHTLFHDYLGDTVSIRIYDKQDGSSARLYGPQITGGVFGPGIGLRKTDGDLAERLDTAIDALMADGTLKAISLKWLGADLVSRP